MVQKSNTVNFYAKMMNATSAYNSPTKPISSNKSMPIVAEPNESTMQTISSQTSRTSDETAEYEYPGDRSCELESPIPFADDTSESSTILKAALDELELERSRRIQLEIQLSELPKKRNQNTEERQSNSSDTVKLDQENALESQICSLSIEYLMNAFFGERTTISKRSIPPKLSEFFSALFDKAIEEAYGKKHGQVDEKAKDIRIKSAIKNVYSECDKTFGSRLMRVEYHVETLRPVLRTVASNFVKSLIEDTSKEKCGIATLSQSKSSKDAENTKKSRENHLKQLVTERDGYLTLINALTSDNDAVKLSAKKSASSLPLHIVRFLEIMPWDDRAQDYISEWEVVTEWQAYDVRTGYWSDKKVKAVPLFRQLPINKMEMCDSRADSNTEPMDAKSPTAVLQHVFDSFALNGRVLTNASCSHMLDLSGGYPLPAKGTWEWVGNWVLTDGAINSYTSTVVDAEGGWNYADNIEALISDGSGRIDKKALATSRFRKRTWSRQRVLVAYPGISQATKQMLSMSAQNAKLKLALSKLHDQINDMQNESIQKEEEHNQKMATLMSQLSAAEADVLRKQGVIANLLTTVNEKKNAIKSPTKSPHKYPFYDDISPEPLLTLEEVSSEDSERSLDKVQITVKLPTKATKSPGQSPRDNANSPTASAEAKVEKIPPLNKENKITDAKPDSSKFIDNTRWKKSTEYLLETMRTNVETVITNVETISEKARERVNSRGG